MNSMNNNLENKTYMQKDTRLNNIYLVMKKINESVTTDEKLKLRTRNGGFIAWPKTNMRHHSLQEIANPEN